MYDDNQRSKDECISWAYSALGLSLNAIKILFHDKDQCFLDYPVKDRKQSLLEISFKDTVLTCLFSEDDICKEVFLFPDKESDTYVQIK